MNDLSSRVLIRPQSPDAAGVLSWVQLGDLHMRSAEDQNHADLLAIVDELNRVFANCISFVVLPGDNADHGDISAYKLVRHALDILQAPWCAIVGDHDIEQKSHDNFRTYLCAQTNYAFSAGRVRFLALNAFDIPDPQSFTILSEQLRWIEAELVEASGAGKTIVLLLHCYPSDLKQGGEELAQLISKYSVRLVAMGHTHYNEISHDGTTVYTATRSTGQIEEGQVGFSVTNLDHGVVSWRFLELGALPAVIITSPADERLLADQAESPKDHDAELVLRAKVWSCRPISSVEARLGDHRIAMRAITGSACWEALFPQEALSPGVHAVQVIAQDDEGKSAEDRVEVFLGQGRPTRKRAARDQDNPLGAWPEHGLMGTQLGPNKNGRKW